MPPRLSRTAVLLAGLFFAAVPTVAQGGDKRCRLREKKLEPAAMPTLLGEERQLEPGEKGMVVSVNLWLHLRCQNEDGGRRLQACLGSRPEAECHPLNAFPLERDVFRIEVTDQSAENATFRVRERGCADEAFYDDPTLCMPAVDRGWRGIAVRGPASVSYARGLEVRRETAVRSGRTGLALTPGMSWHTPQIFICGRYLYNHGVVVELGLWPTGSPSMTILDEGTGERVSMTVRQFERHNRYVILGIGGSWTESRPFPMPEPDHNRAGGADFKLDIGPYIAQPDRPTTYHISLQYGPYRSNELSITVTP